jgi:hypothetical protein
LRTRTLAYEAAMARLTTNYPDDNEAAIFYALALNEAVDLSDKTYAKQFKAASILQAIEAKLPNHPGIPHYIIHSYDFAAICQQGLPAAQRYAELAPTAPHALHMPSHTFSMLGMWEESIAANIKTIAASQAYAAKNNLDGIYAAAPHSYDFMQYAYLQLGQDGKARALMAEVAHPGQRDWIGRGARALHAGTTGLARRRGPADSPRGQRATGQGNHPLRPRARRCAQRRPCRCANRHRQIAGAQGGAREDEPAILGRSSRRADPRRTSVACAWSGR